MDNKKRIYQNEVDDIDRRLLSGLHHVEWKDVGISSDHTRYGSSGGKLKQNERKKIHKVTV